MQQLQSDGSYNELYPKTDAWTKDETLSAQVATMFGLSDNYKPNDAFLVLYVGIGKYAYRVKVQFSDGSPVAGSTVSGINAIPGKTLITGDDGVVLGVSDSPTVNIGCTSPYIDQKTPDIQSIISTGIVTNVTLVLKNETDLITITSSQTINRSQISKFAKDFDLAGVNGGQNGVHGSAGNTGGAGGASGYSKKIAIPNKDIQFIIGSNRDADSTEENETYIQIDGVKHTFSTQYSGRPQPQSYPGGYGRFNGASGIDGYHIFGESTLEVVGSSGGAGGVINNFNLQLNENTTAHGGNGGKNAGGGGSATYISRKNVTASPGTDAIFYGCGGGGGANAGTDVASKQSDGGKGKAGAAWIRFHF